MFSTLGVFNDLFIFLMLLVFFFFLPPKQDISISSRLSWEQQGAGLALSVAGWTVRRSLRCCCSSGVGFLEGISDTELQQSWWLPTCCLDVRCFRIYT